MFDDIFSALWEVYDEDTAISTNDDIFAISAYGQEIYVGDEGIREIHGQYYRPEEALKFLNDESDPVNTNQPDPYKQTYLED